MIFRRVIFPGLIIVGFLTVLQLQSCRLDEFDTSPDLRLSFNTDSLIFDTVFTTVGSSTRFFKIHNRQDKRVNISYIELAGGIHSYFRINVDGRSGIRIKDVEIGARDSLFVFVEVTVDPTGQDLPLVISDSIIFHLNHNVQDVKLIAWGQDANFIKPNITNPETGFSYHLIREDAVWSGSKPYIIYGYVFISPGVTLKIEKGTRVHLHNRSAMIFFPESSLKIEGTLEEQVVIQGDRLEPGYRELPGQWGYIWLLPGSRNHEINYAVIKNGTKGIVMDSIGSLSAPTLKISNAIVKNMEHTGLELNGAWVDAHNLVVSNCRVHAIVARFGGNYNFRHVTVANYYNLPGTVRQTPSVIINNYYRDSLGRVHIRPIEKAFFGNSIIYGNLPDEVLLDFYPENSVVNFSFDYSLIRTTLHQSFSSHFQNGLFSQNPLFINHGISDVRLQENSPAIGTGSHVIAADIPVDLLGNTRLERVDMGAYQYFKVDDKFSGNR
jgi:hypothetical protein